MKYQFSYLEEPNAYDDRGLANGIPLRVHRDGYRETKGALRAQADWNRLVGPIDRYHGGLGPRYSFMQVTVPECLPERLEVISYANEFAFLYDDEMEKLIDHDRDPTRSNEMVDSFGVDQREQPSPSSATASSSSSTTTTETTASRANALQAQVFQEMLTIDKPRAVTSMKAWSTFLQLASRSRVRPAQTLAEYLPMRIIDAGELIWFGTLTFGMGLTIPDEELEVCMKLARPGYAAISLTNDLFSWKKERADAELAGVDYVFNAVWVIMQEGDAHGNRRSEAAALAVCEAEIRRYIAEFDGIVGAARRQLHLSRDTLAYLEAVRHSHVGNLVWSIYCPRYQV
ncbi:terpene synthase family protein [Aspergillus fijiensis CBS 313.89]|uniref:Fusicoccadiene synthase n=1 Tax=Aspergillus fijiensis CBS 313.89 TaxID=1448319 RepID=A0A8G1S565_9EURO|nr:fusicoccadiene synthase [Aspergillus fijiensis CBS 313.89]RAK82731.1 fusicoccadiene synthase [Aspergillus fijiensis CBS 313.89]